MNPSLISNVDSDVCTKQLLQSQLRCLGGWFGLEDARLLGERIDALLCWAFICICLCICCANIYVYVARILSTRLRSKHLKIQFKASFNFFMASALTVLEAGLALKTQGSLVHGLHRPLGHCPPTLWYSTSGLRIATSC